MENTLENKAKFFAQYLNQKVLICNGIHVTNHPQKLTYIMLDPDWWKDSIVFLELKSVSSILKWKYPEQYAYKDLKHLDSIEQADLDLMRSKGYALPFHDLSIEKQIEYGWVKLIK